MDLTINSKHLQEFTNRYCITIHNTVKVWHKMNVGNDYFNDPADANVVNTYRIEKEKLLTVDIPESRLRILVEIDNKFYQNSSSIGFQNIAEAIIEKEWEEKELRAKYPAVQAAWENYSMVLNLCKNEDSATKGV